MQTMMDSFISLAPKAIFSPTVRVNSPTDCIAILCNLSGNLFPNTSPTVLPTI